MATDEDNHKSMEKELSCTLCLELYTNPVMLPCLHSFCYTCLEGFLKAKPCVRNILRCPICRIGVELNSADLNHLQKNFQLASIVDVYRQIRGVPTMSNHSKPVQHLKPKLEVANDDGETDEMPILPLASNIVDGHLTQPNSFYIDSDAESTDEEESWNAEFNTLNQDFNFFWIGTLRDLQHIRLPVWNPTSTNDTTGVSTTRTIVEPSQQLPPARRNALIRNFGSNNLQSSGTTVRPRNFQLVQPNSRNQPTRKGSKIANFFRKHFTR